MKKNKKKKTFKQKIFNNVLPLEVLKRSRRTDSLTVVDEVLNVS